MASDREHALVKSWQRNRLHRQANLHFWPGFLMACAGVAFCLATGLHNDWHNIAVPAAKVGALMFGVGAILIILGIRLQRRADAV